MRNDMTETTITMEFNRLQRLENYCKLANVSKSRIIILCLNRYIPKLKRSNYRFGPTQYQKRASKWENVHVYLHPATAEKYRDVDRHLKYTFSLLVALALDIYAEIVINELLTENKDHNIGLYHDFYSVFSGYTNNQRTFTFIWGRSNSSNTITIDQTVLDKRLLLLSFP
jgi:hypothetical protein